MRRLNIIPGTSFGDLEVILEVESHASKRQFLCKCQCGQRVTVRLDHLRSGHTQSCGRCGLEWKGQRRTLVAWASLYGIRESTLRARLKQMDLGEALERG